MRDACGSAHIKVILATGECGTMQKVMQASLVCMMAGADFIKTSTGKEGVNATFETGFCMVIAQLQFGPLGSNLSHSISRFALFATTMREPTSKSASNLLEAFAALRTPWCGWRL
jgi:hypothetical protein